jgi:hypothetical protein
MQISFPRTESRILPSIPVEILVLVDRKAIRAAIDWSTIQRLTGDDSIDDAAVRTFIRDNRERIEVAIKAHLLAHGVPLSGHLVLTLDEIAGRRCGTI